ncbi:MAG TPA: hypothetical protein VFZ69_15130 [Longimicrobiales bacterium]
MRAPAEVTLSAALAAVITAGYLAVARGGPPAASGLVGHGLGLAGFALMALGTAGYAWRKRRSGPGSMQWWLQAHVVSGIIGPYLALLHTGFAFRGLAGVAFLLVAVVVASGLVGRFAYTAVPRPPPGYAADVARRWTEAVEQLSGHNRPTLFAASGGARGGQESLLPEPQLLAREVHAAERMRALLAVWWVLHVPVALAMFALAVIHSLAALYYATLLR